MGELTLPADGIGHCSLSCAAVPDEHELGVWPFLWLTVLNRHLNRSVRGVCIGGVRVCGVCVGGVRVRGVCVGGICGVFGYFRGVCVCGDGVICPAQVCIIYLGIWLQISMGETIGVGNCWQLPAQQSAPSDARSGSSGRASEKALMPSAKVGCMRHPTHSLFPTHPSTHPPTPRLVLAMRWGLVPQSKLVRPGRLLPPLRQARLRPLSVPPIEPLWLESASEIVN